MWENMHPYRDMCVGNMIPGEMHITVTLVLKQVMSFKSGRDIPIYPMLNKNTLSVKKVRGQSEAALQIDMCDQKL